MLNFLDFASLVMNNSVFPLVFTKVLTSYRLCFSYPPYSKPQHTCPTDFTNIINNQSFERHNYPQQIAVTGPLTPSPFSSILATAPFSTDIYQYAKHEKIKIYTNNLINCRWLALPLLKKQKTVQNITAPQL